jgi:uncharacterized protein
MERLFFNSVGRIRSGWRFLFFAFAFWLCAAVVFTVVFSFATFAPVFQDFLNGNWGFVVQNLINLSVAAGVAFACQKLLEDLPVKTLGWTFHDFWWRDFVFGIVIGISALLAAVGIAAAAGAMSFRVNQFAFVPAAFASSLFSSGVIFLVGAAAEETLFRGYALQTLTRARLAWLAVLLTSLPFALGHLNNPNVIPAFTFANTALAGIWFGAAYLKTRSLWFPFAMHFVWNWAQAQFFGIPVSGITRLTPVPLLESSTVESLNWISGGKYGIEGGAACTVALALATVTVWLLPFPKPDAELFALTNQENPIVAPRQV